MSDPTRATTAGRAYLDLRARARAEGRATDELLVLYVLERFLYRVSVSEHRDRLVLKGGMLLAALDRRRPTRDVDLLALGSANDIDTVVELVTPILQIDVDDGVEFLTTELTAGTIRDQAAYSAVRVAVPATLATARVALKIDVNVGDPVTPAPAEISYPRSWASRSRWWATRSRRSWPRSWSRWSSVPPPRRGTGTSLTSGPSPPTMHLTPDR